jgi:hypothetical protein
MPIITAAALLFAVNGIAVGAGSTRIAERGAFLLGNAHRCGVPDDRVVRAGRVIRELIVSAADDASEQTAAKSRFAEIFRESAQTEGDRHPPCKTVLTQFERLEQFHGGRGAR